jgi:hypothetical protein
LSGAAGRQRAAEFSGVIGATSKEMPLDEFAAAVAATDPLVTVDTMAVHCGGAGGTSGMAHAASFSALVPGNWAR